MGPVPALSTRTARLIMKWWEVLSQGTGGGIKRLTRGELGEEDLKAYRLRGLKGDSFSY